MRARRLLTLCLAVTSILSGQVRKSITQCLHGIRTAAESFSPLAVRAIAPGGSHSVVLAWDGTVWTWGGNSEGQLGNGRSAPPPGPAEVSGLTGVVAISAGYAHTLALQSDGTVWAWGKNREGQLGVDTVLSRATPAQVPGLAGVVSVAAGNSHSLAVKSDGTVWAWGSDGVGELGDGTNTNRVAPAPVLGLAGVTAVAAGQAHSLALKRDGTVWAWGHNGYGQLGIGTMGSQSLAAPAQVGGLTGVTAIAAGYQHSMALKADGTVWVWGNDGVFAILGPAPVQAIGLTNVQAIAAGYGTSLAVKGDGTVWQWGLDILSSPIYTLPPVRSTPTQVMELTGVERVALPFAGSHGLAMKSDGTVWEWGGFLDSELGWATTARPVPSRLDGLSDVVALSASLALKDDGTLWLWDPPFIWGWMDRPRPFQVSGLNGVVAIASGTGGYNLALKDDGTVWNVSGPSSVYNVPNLTEVVAVAAGEARALAVKRDGTVWAWSGLDSTPVQVSQLDGVAAVAEAFLWYGEESYLIRSVALKRDGTVWTWDELYSSRPAPVQVSGLAGIKAIAGGQISLALKDDGTVWQWDAAANKPAPVRVSGLAGVKAVAIGAVHFAFPSSDAHGLALRTDGTVWAWGPNEFGQLGDGTTAYRAAPVQVAGLSEVAAIGAAGFSSVAVKRDGTVWAWGAGANRVGKHVVFASPGATAGFARPGDRHEPLRRFRGRRPGRLPHHHRQHRPDGDLWRDHVGRHAAAGTDLRFRNRQWLDLQGGGPDRHLHESGTVQPWGFYHRHPDRSG